MTTIIIIVAIYFIAMVVIGWMGKKHSSTFEESMNISRKAGIFLIMGGAIGGHIGNGFVVGGAAEGAAVGYGGALYGLGCATSYVLLSFTINNWMWKHNYLTLAEYLVDRYQDKATGLIYDFATALSYIGIMASQLMAGGALFEAIGLNAIWGVIAITAVVWIYASLSGLWGAFATSVVQVAIIIVGVVTTTVVLLSNGAIETINAAVSSGALPASYTGWIGYDPETFIAYTVPTLLLVFIDQSTWQRVNSAKSAKTSMAAHLLSFALMIPLALMPAFIGTFAAAEYGVSGTAAFFTVVLHNLPDFIAGLTIAAVLAAVMSTVDALFIGFSAVIVSDIYKRSGERTQAELKRLNLICNTIIAVVAAFAALQFTSIVGLLSNVYTFLAGCCFCPLIFGILWKKGTPKAALWSAIVGGVWVLLQIVGLLNPPYSGIFPILPAAVVYVIVALLTQPKGGSEAAA